MRLLYFQDNGTLTCTDFTRKMLPPYAILSHTWGEEEVTYQDLKYSVSTSLAGFKKIAFCGEQASKDGLKYFWVDTCCIDKQNLPELTRSINSMFRWYGNAAKCYVYLSDVTAPNPKTSVVDQSSWMEAFSESRWFTRGWTLQELIAPRSVEFFSAEGQPLGNKSSLERSITEITGIPADALQGRSPSEFSVDERFAWANHRETTEEEDIAYCLLGIFDVFMPLIPGEGEVNAKNRLKKLVEESLYDKAISGPDHIGWESGREQSSSKRRATTNTKRASKRVRAMLLHSWEPAEAFSWAKGNRDPDAPVILNHWHRVAVSRELAQGANAGVMFQGAQASFLNTVFWDEWPVFETFEDAEEMIANIQSHCESAGNPSRLLIACNSIGRFCLHWAHFFDVVELGMTIDPEWPRTLWAAIRLVFVRCKDCVNMFEKMAQMFDRLTDQLPSYHDHVLRLRKFCPPPAKGNLCKVLALVYADILQFCHDACTLFAMTPGVASPETDPVKELTFLPFMAAFDDLLERVAEHKRLFDIGLHAGKFDELLAFIRRVVIALEEQDKYMQDNSIRRNLQKERRIHNELFLEMARTWIQSPDYKPDLEKARDARKSSTGGWLQNEASYVVWKAELYSSVVASEKHGKTTSTKRRPILWLEGPPGYGKTVLSTVIIDDLEKSAMGLAESSNVPVRSTTAYFYFNAQLPGKRSCLDALRATALQLFEVLQEDPRIVDILSLSMHQAGGDQPTATLENLSEFLRLAVRRLSSLALVLDGIDECQDFTEMWPFLGLACGDPRFKCLCLARPSIAVPLERTKDVQRQSLQGKNYKDIRKYLQNETQALQQAGHLEENVSLSFVAEKLSARAGSRFLWANLIIAYLRSPSLTQTQRLNIIEDPGQLDSLHGLFSGIVRQYQEAYYKDRNLLTKILQILVLTKESLTVDQLNIVISTQPGRKLEKANLLPDFSEKLKKLCGPLIEVTGSAVLFSHLSFRAFLESEDAIDLKSSFRIDKKTGSLQFAAVCLSYLIHDVPQRPLSGSKETAVDQAEIERQLPLSKYSARNWVDHAVSALQLMPGGPHVLMMECYQLLQQLGTFIARKPSISAWIELCWTYHFPPFIERLWLEFERRLAQIKMTAQRGTAEWRIFESLSKVRRLSEDLERLNDHWGHLLLVRPYEIWGSSISVFLGSVSWAHNDDAKITMVASDGTEENLEETILKVSRLSSCGEFIGILRLSRTNIPREPKAPNPCVCKRLTCTCKHDTSSVDLRDAVATYQILKLEDSFPVVHQVNIPLNLDDLHEAERTAEGNDFRFPIAFAPNLQSIATLRTVYWIGADGTLQQQRLSESSKSLDQESPGTYSLHNTFASKPGHCKTRYYKMIFSHCGQFVAHLQRQQDMNPSAEGRWNIIIWERQHAETSTTGAEKQLWKEHSKLLDIYSNFTCGGTFVFNPHFLQIALYEHTVDSPTEVSVWNFGTPTEDMALSAHRSHRKTRMIYATGLHNLRISSCGHYLFGDHPLFQNPRIIELKEYLRNAVPVPAPTPADAQSLHAEVDGSIDVEMVDADEEDYMHVVRSTPTQLLVAQNQRQPVLYPDELALVVANRVPELRVARRRSDGAVVLKRLSSVTDGSEGLLYLPKSLDSSTLVNILDDRQENQNSVRMVLTNDFGDLYTWDNPMNRQSASIITRSAQSITTIENGAAEISSIPNSCAKKLLTIEEYSSSGL